MSEKTGIEWTDATWNPVTGCTKVSPGCANCYIERTPPFRIGHRQFDEKGATGVLLHPERLEEPLHWKKPRRVFVNSLSDLFHEEVPVEFIYKIFMSMWAAPQHQFQILTKRPFRMKNVVKAWLDVDKFLMNKFAPDALPGGGGIERKDEPLANVWLGVSVENQHFADERIPLLLQTPAAVRFISAEPLLGPVDLTAVMQQLQPPVEDDQKLRINALRCVVPKHLDWVIVGGESGPGARPCNAWWIEHLAIRCKRAGIPVFIKQLGAKPLNGPFGEIKLVDKKGGDWNEWPEQYRIREFPQ